MPPTKALTVGLIFHSTRSDNLGVGALTVADIEIIRRAARKAGRDVRFHVIDWKGSRAPYVTGPDITMTEVDGRDIRSPRGYYALARGCDMVVDIGAGDSFADIYGSKRLNSMLAMKMITHLARRPLVVAPQTVGPFSKRSSRMIARLSMGRSAIVATRDRMSTACVRELGVSREVIEASDVALRLPFAPPAPRTAGGKTRVGLNVSGLLLAGGYSRNNMFGLKSDYPALIEAIIGYFEGRGDCELHLVPHVILRDGSNPEDDYSASERLCAAHPSLVLAPAFATPSEAKTYIAGMDFFMGARMHSCIAAFSSGVPVIPMAYSRKFAGLFGSLGYDETVDCTAEAGEAILDRIIRGFEDRANLKLGVERALTEGLQKLDRYEDALAGLLARL
ncbi:MAG: hypothetical protein RLZZ528_300 [Pseudomonadota bacterium]